MRVVIYSNKSILYYTVQAFRGQTSRPLYRFAGSDHRGGFVNIKLWTSNKADHMVPGTPSVEKKTPKSVHGNLKVRDQGGEYIQRPGGEEKR